MTPSAARASWYTATSRQGCRVRTMMATPRQTFSRTTTTTPTAASPMTSLPPPISLLRPSMSIHRRLQSTTTCPLAVVSRRPSTSNIYPPSTTSTATPPRSTPPTSPWPRRCLATTCATRPPVFPFTPTHLATIQSLTHSPPPLPLFPPSRAQIV